MSPSLKNFLETIRAPFVRLYRHCNQIGRDLPEVKRYLKTFFKQVESVDLISTEHKIAAEVFLDQRQSRVRDFQPDDLLDPTAFSKVFCAADIRRLFNLLKGRELFGLEADLYDQLNCDLTLVWRYVDLYRVLSVVTYSGCPLLFAEDAYLKSVLTDAAPGEDRYRVNVAFFLDDLTWHYDSTRASRLERLIETVDLNPDEVARGAAIRRRLVASKLTKYNHQPLTPLPLGRPGRRKVLVIDQSYRDFSVLKSRATPATFQTMLQAALDEHPDADILVKNHPDAVARAKKSFRSSYFQEPPFNERLWPINVNLNPYTMLEEVDAVYTCSSQMGFEAVMAGHETHVFGMPAYAGWGVTNDRQPNPRRTRRRTVDELVYIIYVLYTRYVSPQGQKWEAEQALDYLIGLREEYFRRTKSK